VDVQLTPRQREILRRVVEEYVATGQPVGSKGLVERAELDVSPSTVRNELAELEGFGLLTHPHTSAGRVPTDGGYRLYADDLLDRLEPRSADGPAFETPAVRSELEAVMQQATEMLADATRLLALVSAPRLATTTVRHVEVLLLQPQVALVVLITSTGGVSKRTVAFDAPVDTGLAGWARAYLNETVAGLQLGSGLLRRRLDDPSLSQRERAFLAELAPVFTDSLAADDQRVFVGGAAGLLGDVRADEREACRHLLEMLERRAALLELLGETLELRRPVVRVGDELDSSGLYDVAIVGSGYGLATRTLGSVSLLGPVRMDYEKAIRAVRAAAAELSRYVESVYEES
jgi:heat-inducible transcriptional repressor